MNDIIIIWCRNLKEKIEEENKILKEKNRSLKAEITRLRSNGSIQHKTILKKRKENKELIKINTDLRDKNKEIMSLYNDLSKKVKDIQDKVINQNDKDSIDFDLVKQIFNDLTSIEVKKNGNKQ